jgi:hypothetical protein
MATKAAGFGDLWVGGLYLAYSVATNTKAKGLLSSLTDVGDPARFTR